MDKKIERTMKNLSNRGFLTECFSTKEELKAHLLKEIDSEVSIGIGGSMTIKELGLYEELINRGNTVYWHWEVPKKERVETFVKARDADLYFTSSNGLIENGVLLNIDGVGNRVSAMFSGPKKVFFVVGVNKISENEKAALNRIKNIACPLNAKRLGLKTPCGVSGKCTDCFHEDRMCNITVKLERSPKLLEQRVYIVGEEMGY